MGIEIDRWYKLRTMSRNEGEQGSSQALRHGESRFVDRGLDRFYSPTEPASFKQIAYEAVIDGYNDLAPHLDPLRRVNTLSLSLLHHGTQQTAWLSERRID